MLLSADSCQDHLTRQKLSFDDVRFGITAEQAADLQQGVMLTPKKKDAAEKAGDDALTPEKVAAVNLSREPAQLHRAMESSLKKINSEFKKAMPLAIKAMDDYKKHPAELRSSDRALLAFCRTLQFRHETGVRCLGRPEDLRWIVPDSSAGSSVGQSGPVPTVPGQGPSQPATPSNPGNSSAGAVSVLNGADAVSSEFVQERASLSWENFLKEARTAKGKFWEGELSALRALESVQDSMEELLECKDAAVFLQYKQDWLATEKSLQQVHKGIKQAADDLSKHMKLKVTESAREKRRAEDQKARDELQRVRNEAKEAADQIKKRKLEQQAVVSAIFTCDLPLNLCDAVPERTGLSTEGLAWDSPWVMKCAAELVPVLGDTAMQKALASWGSQYKKTMASTKPKKTQATFPMEEKSGRGLVNQFMQKLRPAGNEPDISAVSGGKQFMDCAWLFGASPDHRTVAFLPNHAPCIRVLVVGEMRHIMIEWDSLSKALDLRADKATEELSVQSILDRFHGLDRAGVEGLAGKVKWMQCTLKPQTALFVPTGWLVVEISANNPLIYGFRKGFFTFEKSHIAKYEEAIQVASNMKHNVERMQQILEILKAAPST